MELKCHHHPRSQMVQCKNSRNQELFVRLQMTTFEPKSMIPTRTTVQQPWETIMPDNRTAQFMHVAIRWSFKMTDQRKRPLMSVHCRVQVSSRIISWAGERQGGWQISSGKTFTGNLKRANHGIRKILVFPHAWGLQSAFASYLISAAQCASGQDWKKASSHMHKQLLIAPHLLPWYNNMCSWKCELPLWKAFVWGNFKIPCSVWWVMALSHMHVICWHCNQSAMSKHVYA